MIHFFWEDWEHNFCKILVKESFIQVLFEKFIEYECSTSTGSSFSFVKVKSDFPEHPILFYKLLV